MKYNELMASYNVDERYLHTALGIPERTLRAWRLEEREAPQYVMTLLNYFIVKEIEEGNI